ncbi:MAG: DUF4091 domain-containing protein [Lentisphaeria bacterium]|nr:DUF4091 domain-containing protein [Lentisphaeria bacterium]
MKYLPDLSAILLAGSTLWAAGPNLMEDPSFEQPVPPFKWQAKENPYKNVKKEDLKGRFSFSKENKIVRSGKQSWKLVNKTMEGRNYISFKPMKCHPDKPFEFKFHTMITDRQDHSYIWYNIYMRDKNGKLSGYINGPNMDIRKNRWNEQVIRIYPAPNTATFAVTWQFCGPMTVYIDDASFREVPHSAYEKTVGKVLHKGSFSLWSESPMCQVPYKGMPKALPAAKEIKLTAAANENESFQLVLTSNKAALSDLSWKFPALKSGKSTIPASAFSSRMVEFVNVTKANDPRARGMIADPLIETPASWSLSKERNSAFFMTVKVPAGTPKGVYKGTIQLQQKGKCIAKVPVSVRVWGFEIPKISQMATFFLTSLHFGKFAYCNFDKRPRAVIMDDIHNLKKEMRISINQALRLPPPKWKIVNDEVVITDWKPFDEAVEKIYKKYNFSYIRITPLGMIGDNAGWFKSPGRKTTRTRSGRHVGAEPPKTPFGGYYDEPVGIKRITSYTRAYLKHVKEKFPHLRPFWYIYDEVPYNHKHTLAKIMTELKKHDPDLPLFIVGGAHSAALPAYQFCCTGLNLRAAYSPGKNHKESIFYQWKNDINPSRTMAARVYAWQVYKANGIGGLLWLTNFCGGGRKGIHNPWTSPTGLYENMHCTIFYPPYQGKGKVVPSQRAWLIREAIEDFDLLKIAEKRLGKAKVEKIISKWIKDPFDWRNDPRLFEQVRIELGDAIEQSK